MAVSASAADGETCASNDEIAYAALRKATNTAGHRHMAMAMSTHMAIRGATTAATAATATATDVIPEFSWKRIICPFFSAFIKNGIIVPNDQGEIYKKDIREVMLRSKIPPTLANFIADFLQEKTPIFHLDGTLAEHDTSTGMRDPLPNYDQWDTFETKFSHHGQFGGIFTVDDMAAGGKWFDETHQVGHSHDDVQHDTGHSSAEHALQFVFNVTTNYDVGAYMSVANFKSFFMESNFPPGFTMKPKENKNWPLRDGMVISLKGGRDKKYCADEGNIVKCNRPWIHGTYDNPRTTCAHACHGSWEGRR